MSLSTANFKHFSLRLKWRINGNKWRITDGWILPLLLLSSPFSVIMLLSYTVNMLLSVLRNKKKDLRANVATTGKKHSPVPLTDIRYCCVIYITSSVARGVFLTLTFPPFIFVYVLELLSMFWTNILMENICFRVDFVRYVYVDISD